MNRIETPSGIHIDPSDPSYDDTVVGLAPVTDKPKVYLFSTGVKSGGDGPAYCIAESGHVLGMHYCSSVGYMLHDLSGLPSRRAALEAHYPGGYEVVVLPLGSEPPADVKARNLALPEDEI